MRENRPVDRSEVVNEVKRPALDLKFVSDAKLVKFVRIRVTVGGERAAK